MEFYHEKAENCVQQSIRHCLSMIAPCDSFEKSEKKQSGKRQFYDWITGIYKGMYEQPEAYLVFGESYERYVEKSKNNPKKPTKEKEHANDSRESCLRNTYQQAIQFYAVFLYKLGLVSEDVMNDDAPLTVPKQAYVDVLSEMNRIHDNKNNEARYEKLTELGLQIQEKGEKVIIAHTEYEEAMSGLRYLCKAPESKFKYMNYLRLDYRNAYTQGPGVEDILRTLPISSAKVITQLEECLKGLKIKTRIRPLRGIVSDFKWKAEYSYQGQNICGFYADSDYLMLCVYFNDFQNINRFAKQLQQEDHELFDWYCRQLPERLCKCPSNRRVLLGDSYRRICGLSNRTETVCPDERDIDMVMRILKKYRGLS